MRIKNVTCGAVNRTCPIKRSPCTRLRGPTSLSVHPVRAGRGGSVWWRWVGQGVSWIQLRRSSHLGWGDDCLISYSSSPRGVRRADVLARSTAGAGSSAPRHSVAIDQNSSRLAKGHTKEIAVVGSVVVGRSWRAPLTNSSALSSSSRQRRH
jgi:hypothetical protein